jgi:MORN repeat
VGQLFSPEGTFYKGEWKDDVRHGIGKISYTDGGSYDSHWDKRIKHGTAKHWFFDRASHDGEMKNGSRQGIRKANHDGCMHYEELSAGKVISKTFFSHRNNSNPLVCKVDRALGFGAHGQVSQLPRTASPLARKLWCTKEMMCQLSLP